MGSFQSGKIEHERFVSGDRKENDSALPSLPARQIECPYGRRTIIIHFGGRATPSPHRHLPLLPTWTTLDFMLRAFAYRLADRVVSPARLQSGVSLDPPGDAERGGPIVAARRAASCSRRFSSSRSTNACNLRCRGCWIESHGKPESLSELDVDRIIGAAKRQHCRFFTLLGGEPLLYPRWWEIPQRHRDCYFQIITNGSFLGDENVGADRRVGQYHATGQPGRVRDFQRPAPRPRRFSGRGGRAWPPPPARDSFRRGHHGDRSQLRGSDDRRLRRAGASTKGRSICGTTCTGRWGPIPRPSSL